MQHQVKKIWLGKEKNERRRLLRALVQSFIRDGKLTTTRPRARAVVSSVDHVITLLKRKTNGAREKVIQLINDRSLFDKLVKDVLPAMDDRKSGYVRRILLGSREGDNTEMVKLVWVKEINKVTVEKKEEKGVKEKKVAAKPNKKLVTGEKKVAKK